MYLVLALSELLDDLRAEGIEIVRAAAPPKPTACSSIRSLSGLTVPPGNNSAS
jgi:hypothetical protein